MLASHAKETDETAEDKPAVTEPLDLSKSNEAANSGLNSDHAKDATGSNSLNDAVSGSVDDNKVEKGIANKDQATPVSDTAKTDAQKKVEQQVKPAQATNEKTAEKAAEKAVDQNKDSKEISGSEQSAADKKTDDKTKDELKLDTAKQGKKVSINQAKTSLIKEAKLESNSKYNVNDWQYTTAADGITLTGYTGQGTDYYIPNGKSFRDAGTISAGQKVYLPYDTIQKFVNTDKATSISVERATDDNDKVVAVGYADGSAQQFNSAFAPNQSGHNNNIDQGSNGNQALESVTGLDTWKFSSDMHSAGHMFAFDPNLKIIKGIDDWDTSNFKYVDNLVKGDTSLTELDLSRWKTDNVIFANNMFDGASALTTVGDLSNWRLNNATTTADMFNGATALNGLGKLDNWGLGKDTKMSGMFKGTSSLTSIGDIHSWDVSNVRRMDNMFNGTAISNFNISGWHFNSGMKTHYGTDDSGNPAYGPRKCLLIWSTQRQSRLMILVVNLASLVLLIFLVTSH